MDPSLCTILKGSKQTYAISKSPGIKRTVEIISWFFNEVCTCRVVSTYWPSVMIALVARLTNIPIAGMQSTNTTELKLKMS